MSQADLPTYIVTYQLTNRSLYISSVHVALRKKELINNEHQLALSRDQFAVGKTAESWSAFIPERTALVDLSVEVPVRRSGFQKTTGTAFRLSLTTACTRWPATTLLFRKSWFKIVYQCLNELQPHLCEWIFVVISTCYWDSFKHPRFT